MDTDVVVLAKDHASEVTPSACGVITGNGDKLRIFAITKINQKFGKDMISALVSMHALTGWDPVSSFGGRVKQRPTCSFMIALLLEASCGSTSKCQHP